MAVANSAPGAFLTGIQDDVHADSVLNEKDLEFYWDSTNQALKAKLKFQGTTYTPSTSATGTELDVLDGVTAGTATASKAVVLDGSKGIATITSATITTLTAPTVNATNVDAGASGTAGTVDIFPSTASKGKASISVTDQTGDTTVSIAVGAMGAARTITLRDPGAAASFLTSTDGTAAATTATAAEITRAADVSTRLVAAGAALSATEASHDGRIIALDTAAGSTVTLPAASGSGAVFLFLVTTVPTSNSHIVKVANASDTMIGQVSAISDDAGNTVKPFYASGTDDTITLNRSTTGGTRKGEWVRVIDAAANLWFVEGCISQTGTEATPFSATV